LVILAAGGDAAGNGEEERRAEKPRERCGKSHWPNSSEYLAKARW
jgi:hypothetical protein